MDEKMIVQVEVGRIQPGRFQPRGEITLASIIELAANIKRRGVITPLLAVEVGNPDGPAHYELIAGERRWRAAMVAELGSVPVLVADGDDKAVHEMAIVENLQREDLTALEEGRAVRSLMELHGYSQRQVAKQLSKSQAWVQQRLALLDASPKIQEMVNTRVFSLAHARALAPLPHAVQEQVAGHLDQVQEAGVAVTSRQVGNLGRKVKQFLDPERFVGVEQKIVDPMLRNGWITLRHLLQTLPEEQLGLAVQRLLDVKQGSSESKLLGCKRPGNYDMVALLTLLRDPEGWTGCYDRRGDWWNEEVARAVGRTCDGCALVDVAAPKEPFSGWTAPCARWGEYETLPVTCENCILTSDAPVFLLRAHYLIDREDEAIKHDGYFYWVESVAYYVRLVEKGGRRERERAVQGEKKDRNVHRERLEAFRRVCESAKERKSEGKCPLDVGHFQAQWCGHCALGGESECALIERPIGNKWEKRPKLSALVLVEDKVNDGEKRKVATWVVPRCEMFRFARAPSLAQVGWLTFSKMKKERRATVIRWLHAMLCKSSTREGVWSPLRWLPYQRAWERHYDLDKLLQYVLKTWDGWGDAGIGTLLNVAASECEASKRGSSSLFPLYNAETGMDEHWAHVDWDKYIEGRKQGYGWPESVEWPFVTAD